MRKMEGDPLLANRLPELASAESLAGCMAITAARSRAKKTAYHVIVSWDPGDEVDRDQMKEVATRLLAKLGLGEHQAIAVQHVDCEHPHLHIVANRVHEKHGELKPDGKRYRVWKGWKDMAAIEEELRAIELQNEWRIVPGRNAIQVGMEIPERNRVTKKAFHARKAASLPAIKAEVKALGARVFGYIRRGVWPPIPPDLPRTAKAFYGVRNAALAGDAECQYKMGQLFELGAGVKKDMAVGAKWYRAAAEQDHEQAAEAHAQCVQRLAQRQNISLMPLGMPRIDQVQIGRRRDGDEGRGDFGMER